MKFQYSGVTRTRDSVDGIIEANDEVEARMRLRAMQIRPTEVAVAREGGGGGAKAAQTVKKAAKGLVLSKPINIKGLVIFTRQFSSLIDSGVPIVQCLDILLQQEKKKAFKAILTRVKDDIEGGSGLAEALGKHRSVFSDFFIRIVEAGELSGTLDKSFKRVGQQLEKLGRLKTKVIGALIYPVITLCMAVFVLIFMLVKVIPEVSKLYADSQAKLPELTVAIMELSKWFQANFAYVIGGIIGSVVAMAVIYPTRAFRLVWDPLILKVPIIGTLMGKAATASFARTMSTLISSGVPLLSAFEICSRLVTNLAIKSAIEKASASVAEGKTIAQGLQTTSVFPPMVLHMINIGEMTGRLDELLSKVADIYDEEVDDAVGTLTGVLQPLLIIAVGSIIAFLLLAMYLPIFQLAEKVSGV